MGSWNETCGVTNLAIHEDDPVRLFLIERSQSYGANRAASGFCYVDGMWRPRFLPIKGVYDDYGSIRGVEEDLNTRIVATDLASYSGEGPEDEDDPDEGALGNLLRRVERGKFRVPSPIGTKVELGQMLVLERAYQHVVSIGYEPRESLLLGPVTFFGDADPRVDYTYLKALRALGLAVKSGNMFNKADDQTTDSPEVAALRERSVELYRFYAGMETLRKAFAPQTGKGSQDDSTDAVVKLGAVICEIATSRKNRFE